MTIAQVRDIYARIRADRLGRELDPDARPKLKVYGFVSWDAMAHRDTFFDAILTGLTFAQTDMGQEWLLVGPTTLNVVRSLTKFTENVPVKRDGPFIYVGDIANIQCFTNMEMADWTVTAASTGTPEKWPRHWLCGCGDRYIDGQIINLPT